MTDTSDVYRFENGVLICDETGDVIELQRADPSMIEALSGFAIIRYADRYVIEYCCGNYAGVQFGIDGSLSEDKPDDDAVNIANFLKSMPLEYRRSFLSWMCYGDLNS
jgi:hypothetical protein